jgi:hypothetical protein
VNFRDLSPRERVDGLSWVLDDSHEWLRAPRASVEAITNESEDFPSGSSFASGGWWYLEADCDATFLLRALAITERAALRFPRRRVACVREWPPAAWEESR